MRHFISSVAKAAHPRGMRSTTGPGALVAAASFPLPGPPGSLPAVATTVDVAAIASAANDDERPAAGARVQAARGLHWRFLQNAKEEESNKVDGPREQCDTDGSHGCLGRLAGRQCGYLVGGAASGTTWRLGPALHLLFFFGKRLSTTRRARSDAGHVSSRPTGSFRRARHQHPAHRALIIPRAQLLVRRHAAAMRRRRLVSDPDRHQHANDRGRRYAHLRPPRHDAALRARGAEARPIPPCARRRCGAHAMVWESEPASALGPLAGQADRCTG